MADDEPTTPDSDDRPAVRQVASRVVYESPFMTVREDETEYLDGSRGLYSIVDKPDFALVMPVEDDGFWLVQQFRYPLGFRTWEFPQGTFPPGVTGAPDELARAELAEETGLRAGALESLGLLHTVKGFSAQGCHIYLASELTHGEPAREIAEQDMRHAWFGRADVETMIRDGAITDSATIAAYALLLLR